MYVVPLQNPVIGHPRFPDLTRFTNLKMRKLLSISHGCSPDQDPQRHQQSTWNCVWQDLVERESCQTSVLFDKLHGSFVLFPLFSRTGVRAGSRELLDHNNSESLPLQAWNFRKVLLNAVLFHSSLQSMLLCPELKTLLELLKESPVLEFFSAKADFPEKYCTLSPLTSLPALPFSDAPTASVSVSVLSLVSEKPISGQEYCIVVPFEGLEAGDTASSEWEEDSPAF